jgi:hypothetical protein
MRPPLSRAPGIDAEVFAEAQALLDDGLDLDFVLDLYGEDARWLAPLLETSVTVIDATRGIQARYTFERSLQARFIAAAREQAARPAPLAALQPAGPRFAFRTTAAAAGVVLGAAATGVLALGIITAGDAEKGDWNYVFRLAGDRVDDTFSGDTPAIEDRIRQTEARVELIQAKSSSGELSSEDLHELEREAEALEAAAREGSLDEDQKADLREIKAKTEEVLANAREGRPELEPEIDSALAKVNDAVAAGTGEVSSITVEPSPTETATTTPEPSPSATPTATATPPASDEGTPEPSPSAESTSETIEGEPSPADGPGEGADPATEPAETAP